MSGFNDQNETRPSPAGASTATNPAAMNTRLRIWDLRFKDAALERDYQRSYFENDVHKTRVGIVCGTLALLIFSVVEPRVVETHELVNQVRLLFIMPVVMFALIATYKTQKHLHAIIVGSSILVTLSQISILFVAGPETVTHTSMAYLHIILFTGVLLFQPFRYVLVPVLLLTSLMVYALRTVGGTGVLADQVIHFEMVITGISLFALLFAYLREHSQRKLFVAHAEVGLFRDATEHQQIIRIDWLKNLSRYLEHELRNEVFKVQSNLEFLQHSVVEDQRPFVDRAMKSASSITELCDVVGESTNLVSALQNEQAYPVNFSDMVTKRVLELVPDSDSVNPLDLDVHDDLWVMGTELHLLQVFDHMLSNALAHSSDETTVRIELKSIAGSVYFSVHNRTVLSSGSGDVFAGLESSNSGFNLGMGLYVSHKIVEHYGGTIEARTQPGQTIALVTLPQTREPQITLGPDAVTEGSFQGEPANPRAKVVKFEDRKRKGAGER